MVFMMFPGGNTVSLIKVAHFELYSKIWRQKYWAKVSADVHELSRIVLSHDVGCIMYIPGYVMYVM